MIHGFHTLISDPVIPGTNEPTEYISHEFPSHVIYRPRYKDNYVTNLVEYSNMFLIRSGTAAKDVKWFQKRFPGMMIEKDKGYGIWLWKSKPSCSDPGEGHCDRCARFDGKILFDPAYRPKLYEAFIERYGGPGTGPLLHATPGQPSAGPPYPARLFTGESFDDLGFLV